jgi:prephenate dehydrogenase
MVEFGSQSMGDSTVQRVLIVGCGMIGTSVALALRNAGVAVDLTDRDPAAVAEGVRVGAGVAVMPGTPPADVVVIATPPSAVAQVLRKSQQCGLGKVYTDVAGAKRRIVADVERTRCDLTAYVPGHPIAGRELSGPSAARDDLFTGLPWALCPHPATPVTAVETVVELVTLCGGVPRILDPETHDRIVAVSSHVPHLVSAALAARFADATGTTLSLVGRGLRDTTRIAMGPPGLWRDILEQNAEPVTEVLESLVRDLAEATVALRNAADHDGALTDLLIRGNRGRARIVKAQQGPRKAGGSQTRHDGLED